MFCPNCGSEVSEKAVVCVKCGVALKPNSPTAGQVMPKTWLTESILVTLFCCLPFGIAGIVNAANVSSRFNAGDLNGANMASQQAGKWTKVSFWVGLSAIILYFVFVVFIFGVGSLAALANW
ncbi:MAG: CD225/dispanin family protein [Bacteroidales bacterium]|nr:CD225/dispanin family protein [Bacteroidales bacterium]